MESGAVCLFWLMGCPLQAPPPGARKERCRGINGGREGKNRNMNGTMWKASTAGKARFMLCSERGAQSTFGNYGRNNWKFDTAWTVSRIGWVGRKPSGWFKQQVLIFPRWSFSCVAALSSNTTRFHWEMCGFVCQCARQAPQSKNEVWAGSMTYSACQASQFFQDPHILHCPFRWLPNSSPSQSQGLNLMYHFWEI